MTVEKRPLGQSGISVAPLALGGNVFGWTADEPTSFDILDAFVDAGGNMVDSADVAKAMTRFFEEGDKVKVTLRFRGREMAHPELGMKLLQKVKADFEPTTKVEDEPKMEGKQMIMILAPK